MSTYCINKYIRTKNVRAFFVSISVKHKIFDKYFITSEVIYYIMYSVRRFTPQNNFCESMKILGHLPKISSKYIQYTCTLIYFDITFNFI